MKKITITYSKTNGVEFLFSTDMSLELKKSQIELRVIRSKNPNIHQFTGEMTDDNTRINTYIADTEQDYNDFVTFLTTNNLFYQHLLSHNTANGITQTVVVEDLV